MAKIATKYLKTHPHKIIEEGLHVDRLQVSESLFSLANEYSGVRGFFEEGGTFDQGLVGSYFNGIYDYSQKELETGYLGIVKKSHFMINAVNYLRVKLEIDGELLDLKVNSFQDFYRELDLNSGLLTRSFIWQTKSGAKITLTFKRFLSLNNVKLAFQRVNLKSDREVKVNLAFLVDNKAKHWGKDIYWQEVEQVNREGAFGILAQTLSSEQLVLSLSQVVPNLATDKEVVSDPMIIGEAHTFVLKKEQEAIFTRHVANVTNRTSLEAHGMVEEAISLLKTSLTLGFDTALKNNIEYFQHAYEKSDIVIEGNDEDQQGIRYCLFMLETTYHGYSPFDNIGAKGLTGEAYSGHAFWDSETYCLPYYLFTNLEAARALIQFRYNTLKEAKERARQLDCRGACYPIATLNGKEGAQLWQHASTQFQPTTAVVYALYHYYNLTGDQEFLKKYGLEICLEASRFLLDRGQWDQSHQHFGYYGVMGPDEFKLMVNHNMYTNLMAKFTFEFTTQIAKNMVDLPYLREILQKCDLHESIFDEMDAAAQGMKILYNPQSKLYEQNEGFYTMPHIDIHAIPQEDFPLYHSWTYDRIYRYDMIKQPDVLMYIFLFMSQFDRATKLANYNYYEPRCIHESSLSPSIHSIFASELGKSEEAQNFFSFASRLDLDDYNRNTREGLHLTSIAAAWMNIVYGFGGLRSDGPVLELNPSLPQKWTSYRFSINYHGSLIKVKVGKAKTIIENFGAPVEIKIRGQIVNLKGAYEVN